MQRQCKAAMNTAKLKEMRFLRASEVVRNTQRMKQTPLVFMKDGWKMWTDIRKALVFPIHIAHTNQHPDMVMWSDSAKMVFIVELTVPWDVNVEWTFERILARCGQLKGPCEDQDWTWQVLPTEMGCQWFVGQSTITFLISIGVPTGLRQTSIRKFHETVEIASAWVQSTWGWLAQSDYAHHLSGGVSYIYCWGHSCSEIPMGGGTKWSHWFQMKMAS